MSRGRNRKYKARKKQRRTEESNFVAPDQLEHLAQRVRMLSRSDPADSQWRQALDREVEGIQFTRARP